MWLDIKNKMEAAQVPEPPLEYSCQTHIRLEINHWDLVAYQVAQWQKICLPIQETQETQVQWQPTPVFLPGESRGQRSLASYSPWGFKELDITEQLNTTNIHTNTLQTNRTWCEHLGTACNFGMESLILNFSVYQNYMLHWLYKSIIFISFNRNVW